MLSLVFLLPPTNAAASNLDNMRAIHMGGNWGMTKENDWASGSLPPDYLAFLDRVGADWVGISISLHLESSLDSSVERRYGGSVIPTFTDEQLTLMVNTLRGAGYKVYFTLAFDYEADQVTPYPVARWQLGDPNMPDEDPSILPENWPWDPNHPDHATFVAEFWQSYTNEAVYFAALAERLGVEMYSLGTETERLFRTRADDRWKTEFLDELQAMVAAVRAEYSGLVTYDMTYGALVARDFFGTGSDNLWTDLALDVVGISAYFVLEDSPPGAVLSVAHFETRWREVFDKHLEPLAERTPGLPIAFLEFGYTNALASPHAPAAREFEPWVFADNNGNGLDDTEEMQANIYEALFNVNNERQNLLKGAFLWGHDWTGDTDWANGFGQLHHFAIRDRLAEQVVAGQYSNVLTGSIVDAGDGKTPVHPVNVELRDINTGELLRRVTNHADGSYEFPGVEPGRYILFFDAVGDAAHYVDELFDGIAPCIDAQCDIVTLSTHLDVVAGTNVQNADLLAGASIAGTVTDARWGHPVEGIEIQFFDNVGRLVHSTRTDFDGRYRSSGLVPQLLYVVADGAASDYIVEIYDDVVCPGGDCVSVAGSAAPFVPASGLNSGIDFDLAANPPPGAPATCSLLSEPFRAVHLGASDWVNIEAARAGEIPASFIQELKDLNVNWIGIMQMMHVDDALDSTLSLDTSLPSDQGAAYTDEQLGMMIDTFQAHGFNVYVTLAIEARPSQATAHPIERWAMGGQVNHEGSSENWPWNVDHPGHEQFVTEFWQSYRQIAVDLGRFLQHRGVKMYSLGTETRDLFRTRPDVDRGYPNDFRGELLAMVDSVREVYGGILTYDMHYGEFRWPGETHNHLWDDLDLDVIGVSAYIDEIVPELPTEVLGVGLLDARLDQLFRNYLLPIQRLNSNRPMLFLEGTFSNSIGAPFNSHHNLGGDDSDEDGNGVNDGEEVQANLFQAMFNNMDRHGILGLFIWNYFIMGPEVWDPGPYPTVNLGPRGLLGDEVVRKVYGDQKTFAAGSLFDSTFEECRLDRER